MTTPELMQQVSEQCQAEVDAILVRIIKRTGIVVGDMTKTLSVYHDIDRYKHAIENSGEGEELKTQIAKLKESIVSASAELIAARAKYEEVWKEAAEDMAALRDYFKASIHPRTGHTDEYRKYLEGHVESGLIWLKRTYEKEKERNAEMRMFTQKVKSAGNPSKADILTILEEFLALVNSMFASPTDFPDHALQAPSSIIVKRGNK